MPIVTLNGVRTAYKDTGSGAPDVLLVHGFPLNSRMWDPQVAALSERFRSIAPDLRGFGHSDAPEDAAAYSMDAYADDLKMLLDHLDVPRVVLVGLSMGGYIAFAFLRKYPDAVSALVLADTRAEADSDEGIRKREAQQSQIREEGTAGVVETLTAALLSDRTKEKKPDVVEVVKQLMNNPASGFVGALEAMKRRVDSTADLEKISVPTLVLVGEHDTIAPPDASRSMHERIADSRLVVVPEAGHLSNLEAPDAFNGALAEFLLSVKGS